MADIKKIKIGNTTYDIVDAGAARKEQVVTVVDTLADVPNNEFGLYRHGTEEGGSNLVEVVSTLHEGGEGNTFTKTTTANNQSIAAAAILSHFDTALSNFVAVTEATQVYTLYQAFNGEPVISGFRLGSSKNQGSLTLEFLQDGQLIVSKYFTINGSTGEVASSDASSQVIVDGTTYMLASESDFVEIPVTAGTHTITSGSGSGTRAILVGFSFSSEAFYTFEKKYLARQEDLDSLAEVVTKNNNEATTKHADFESRITKNKQDISVLNATLGDVQIFDVINSLPRASMNHLDKIYRKDHKLYQCVKTGDGDHKDFAFNFSGSSEILDTHLEQLYPTIAKDFEDYFAFDLENSSKVFRNDGSIKLGSSGTTGRLHLICQDSRDLTALKIGVKAYNTKKSSFYLEVSTNSSDFTKNVLVEDATNETFIDFAADLKESETSSLVSIWIETTEAYVDEETDTTTTTDKRGVITRVIADFGDVSYEWIPVTGDTKVTYAELVALRAKSQLIPGQQYRIIDYICTTSQETSTSAEHPFDIIVIADNESVLNENARAIQHDGDDYFAEANLSAWQLKYCLDNDTTRFAWADVQKITNLESALSDGEFLTRQPLADGSVPNEDFEEYYYAWGTQADIDDGDSSNFIYSKTEILSNGEEVYSAVNGEAVTVEVTPGGKGVIYYMKDEYNNEAPYDFKNIQFKRAISFDDEYNHPYYDPDNGEDVWLYTFTAFDCDERVYLDATLINSRDLLGEATQRCYGNKISEWRPDNGSLLKIQLNDIVFLNKFSLSVGGPYECMFNTFEAACHHNTFGSRCTTNTFGTDCSNNTFGQGCHFNSFANYCENNTFGDLCYYNVFGSKCKSNIFGDECNSNTFGVGCSQNTFGDNCYNNTFGEYAKANSFKNNCFSNFFGDYVQYNSFKDYGVYNRFGDMCKYNSFGNYSAHNTFSNSCQYITYGDAIGVSDYYKGINIETACRYLYINSEDTEANSTNYVQYITIHKGVTGSSDANRLTITVPDRNLVAPIDYYVSGSQEVYL